MAKPPITDQPLMPRTLRDWIRALVHRSPVMPVPHWDVLTAGPLPVFDEEAEWTALEPQIARLALDEAHGDVIDRLVEDRVSAYHETIDRRLEVRRSEIALPREQGGQHFIRLERQVIRLRNEQAQHAERAAFAWEQVCGTAPARAEAHPTRAVPLATQAYVPPTASQHPNAEPIALSVPEPNSPEASAVEPSAVDSAAVDPVVEPADPEMDFELDFDELDPNDLFNGFDETPATTPGYLRAVPSTADEA